LYFYGWETHGKFLTMKFDTQRPLVLLGNVINRGSETSGSDEGKAMVDILFPSYVTEGSEIEQGP
jgi:hypothetical protein